CSDEARDNKGEDDAQYGEDEGESGTLIAVCLRQDIACSNVEQKAGKEAQVVGQSNGRNCEEHSGDGTSHRCPRVNQQQEEGTARGVLIDEHQRDGIEAIGEVVRDDGNRHDQSNGGAYLKAQADAHTVQKAVAGQRNRRKDANQRVPVHGILLFMGEVDEDGLLRDVEEEKAAHQRQHGSRTIQVQRVDEPKNLRQQVKGDQADQHTRRKTHNEIEMIAIAQPEKAAYQRREE